MLKALIVDDELKSRESLKILIEDFCESIKVIGLCESLENAIQYINQDKPDVVFLDIQMNKESGLELFSRLPKINFEVVFTTAYSEYAIDAIKNSALDYLLKPINIDELRNTIKKVHNKVRDFSLKSTLELMIQNSKNSNSDTFKLSLPTSDGLIFISFKDILYCEAESNYTFFHMRGGAKHIVSKTLKEYEDVLSDYNFLRIHNSYLVNLKEVKKYVKGDGGYVIMSNDASLDVSKRKKDFFLTKVSGLKII